MKGGCFACHDLDDLLGLGMRGVGSVAADGGTRRESYRNVGRDQVSDQGGSDGRAEAGGGVGGGDSRFFFVVRDLADGVEVGRRK